MLRHLFFPSKEAQEAEYRKAAKTASAILSLEDTEGWKAFVKESEKLVAALTPDVATFNSEDAVKIAAQMAFISGVKRCIGLMQQQKDILASLRIDAN